MFAPLENDAHILEQLPITYNHHSFGVSAEKFKTDAGLKKMFKITSTSLDNNGVEFVSSMEAYNYPFYGV
jgi:gamma-glutamyl hydrolase